MNRTTGRDVLFLCSGNVLRSAFCELYARHLGLPFRARSAATHYRNSALFPESRAALQALGVGESELDAFRPTHMDDLEPEPGPDTLVFGMTRDHLTAYRQHWGESTNARLMLTVLDRPDEIADPYFTGDYTGTFKTLAACIEALR